MAALMRNLDWNATSLGDPAAWPQSLRTIIRTMLHSRSPMFLWWGDDLIQFYNDAYRPSLGNSGKHPAALGQKAFDCWPEIWPVIKPLIDQVLHKGDATWAEDQRIPIYRNGTLEEVYWTFGYSPVEDDNGHIKGVLVICTETTNNVHNLQRLKLSEDNFRNLVNQAPVAIGHLESRELVISAANEKMLQVWGKQSEIIGLPLRLGLPELDGQPYLQLLDNVYTSGNPYFGYSHSVLLEHGGMLQEFFFDFVYQPIKNNQGNTTGIMVVANDVTAALLARNKIKNAEETLRLSLKAAQLGTFDMDLVKNSLSWDTRCRELFGIDHYGPVTYEKDFLTNLHQDDRERIKLIIEDVFKKDLTDGNYDVEYRTVGASDKKLRWVRAKGKALFNDNDEPVRFLGSVLDITDKKLEEERRIDFFAMASHELKTPLTAIMGYVQLLQMKALADNDSFRIDALARVNKSVSKMSGLIQGFLSHARITEGKLSLHIEPVDLKVLVADSAEHAAMISASHTICIIACDGISVMADHDVLSQIMENLVSNAIKYSPDGGTITIGCTIENGLAEIYVQDQGVGIRKQDQEKLFERFYRVQNQKVKTVPGFGIGLYLVAEMLRYHNSEIRVDSVEGSGSKFYFRLPLGNSV